MRRSILWIVLNTALATALALLFSTSASAEVIHACVKPNDTLKVVAAPADCGNNETPISLNVGPQRHVFDGDGRAIGLVAGDGVFYVPGVGKAAANFRTGEIRSDRASSAHFTTDDCTGQAYTSWNAAGFVVARVSGAGPYRYFVGDTGVTNQIVALRSMWEGSDCEPAVFESGSFITATELTADNLGLPWPGPLYVALPPE